ncbi:ABC transporter substrate-binding protein [Actinomadura rayongensis]|uniref:ABC transporter substrate-binding protein n=1 Tax=Actinomadura rayongensis TaxID=1429076 RepID=A0A6I4WAJ1_9ACTN|nr:ABC transporter substrate-binding protein [Actinomadura rayongensis]MXQ66611.1 ABC transporter substrate-binding protein [Actinomadura rayongensis]
MVCARSDGPRLRAWLAGLVLLAAALGTSGCGLLGGPARAETVPGVTSRPCPHAVNRNHGCIYLGTLSDLSTGPFSALGVLLTRAQRAFWERVNAEGGIGGYDVDAVTYVRDTGYVPSRHLAAYLEIKDRVLALAQTLGSTTTEEILDDLRTERMLAVPASFQSRWEFEDVILESGTSYCFHYMNAVDYAVRQGRVKRVMSVHFAGDYGADGAGGARIAARAHRLAYRSVQTPQGPDRQAAAVRSILKFKPDVVLLSTGPAETAAIVGQAVAHGYKGRFFGDQTTWNVAVMKSPVAAAMRDHYLMTATWKPFATDAPGYTAMRAALGRVVPDDTLTVGWSMQYPLKAVLERAAQNGRLTRQGLYTAMKETTFVDYEGMMPPAAGDFSGTPNASAFRETVFERPDPSRYTGLRVLTDYQAGATADGYRLDAPCSGVT